MPGKRKRAARRGKYADPRTRLRGGAGKVRTRRRRQKAARKRAR